MTDSLTYPTSTRPIRLILRLEGAATAALATAVYAESGGSWAAFAALLLLPDLSAVGYFAGPRVGAAAYNLFHTYAAPLVLALLAQLATWPDVLPLALIWIAHIGIDRALGYGLKHATGFRATHLGGI